MPRRRQSRRRDAVRHLYLRLGVGGLSASLTILDVGHGNCAVARGDSGVLVVDAGPGGGELLQYLSDEAIDTVSCVVISHADNDHLRGLLAILEEPSVEVAEIRLNPDAAKLTDLWDAV